jgi:cell division septum initiation protein DivIVA
MNTQDLLNLKKKIEDKKTQKNQLEGQLKGYMEQLQNEFGCKTLQAAEAKHTEMLKTIDTLSQELIEKENELREQYPQLFDDEE